MQYLDLNALPISNTDDIRFIVALDNNGKVIKALDTGFATATSVQAQLNETNTQVVDNANAISDLQVKTTNNTSEIANNINDINRLENSVDRLRQLEPRIETNTTNIQSLNNELSTSIESVNNHIDNVEDYLNQWAETYAANIDDFIKPFLYDAIVYYDRDYNDLKGILDDIFQRLSALENK